MSTQRPNNRISAICDLLFVPRMFDPDSACSALSDDGVLSLHQLAYLTVNLERTGSCDEGGGGQDLLAVRLLAVLRHRSILKHLDRVGAGRRHQQISGCVFRTSDFKKEIALRDHVGHRCGLAAVRNFFGGGGQGRSRISRVNHDPSVATRISIVDLNVQSRWVSDKIAYCRRVWSPRVRRRARKWVRNRIRIGRGRGRGNGYGVWSRIGNEGESIENLGDGFWINQNLLGLEKSLRVSG